MQDTRGYNPYKIGFVGARDSHNTGDALPPEQFFGGHALVDGDIGAYGGLRRLPASMSASRTGRPDRRLGGGEHARVAVRRDAAQGNLRHQRRAASRCASSAAGTTTEGMLSQSDWVKTAYAGGVPMGGDLHRRPKPRRRHSSSGR